MDHQDEWIGLIWLLEHPREALRQVAEKCEVAEAKFDMNWWRSDDSACGTSCCAIGLGILTGTITGLSMKPYLTNLRDGGHHLTYSMGMEGRVSLEGGNPITQVTNQFNALSNYFRISIAEAMDCFDAGIPSDPAEVARRMREIAELYDVEVTA